MASVSQDKRKVKFKWYTDGITNIKIKEGDIIPPNFLLGKCNNKAKHVVAVKDNSNNDALNGLTKEEREYALKILKELSSNGTSESYNNLIYGDYDEIPVNIDTFLHDKKYLGRGLINEEGVFTVFPYWEETLKKIFPDPLAPAKYNTLALTGAIGLGKSFMAVLCILYDLYRMLCLKDPYLHYGLQPIDKITFAFMNITLDAAKGVGWDKCQQLLQSSEWFMSHGTVSNGNTPEWRPPKGIELIYGSLSRHIIGRAVFSCFFDEVSFQPNSDVNKQKEKAKNLVNTASARMQSRFMKGEKNPTLLILASSKRTEQSYMETFIESKKKQESTTTYIVDEPQWVIRTDKDSAKKFKVAIGNKFLNSEIVPLDANENDLKIYRDRGYQLIDVPWGYREQFIEDIDIALTDIAGISTTSSNRYISGPRLAAAKAPNLRNAFRKDVIEVGNGKDDTTQYWDFFDMSAISKELMHRPLYIHMDMSVDGDKTGIAGVFIKGKKPPTENHPIANDMFYSLGFSVSIKAPKGHQISFEKNRNFIYWLREQGFNIKGITTDTFQSVDTGQQLATRGFNYSVVSVDRVDSDHICKPWQYFRSTLYDERIELYDATLLTDELLGLERDNNSGKIDHSPSGINSKDQADAVCGAVWRASQDADQYAYDYGDDFENVSKANSDVDEYNKVEINKAFENEISTLLDPMARQNQEILKRMQESAERQQQQLNRQYNRKYDPIDYAGISNGILVW